MFQAGLSFIRTLFRESRCPACTKPWAAGPEANPFCPDCLAALPRRGSGFCPACGELSAWEELSQGLCGHCLKESPPWGRIFFYGAHQGLLRVLLLRLKFGQALYLGPSLGALAAGLPGPEAASESWYTALVPVPLHRTRLAERGYNQALELARPVARRLGIPLRPEWLERVRGTGTQSGLTRAQRRQNLEGAFRASCAVKGQSILLVDDVLTTGATAGQACLSLKAAGATADVLVLSRAPGRNLRSG